MSHYKEIKQRRKAHMKKRSIHQSASDALDHPQVKAVAVRLKCVIQ